MGSGCDPRCRRPGRLRGEPFPDHLHNKGIPKRGLTLPPAALLQRAPATFPASPPKPPGPRSASIPAAAGYRAHYRTPAPALPSGNQLSPTFPTLAAGSSDPHPPRAFPAVQRPCPPVPPAHRSGALRPPSEPSENPLAYLECPIRPTHKNPPVALLVQRLPTPNQARALQPAQDSLPSWGADTDSRDTLEPPPGTRLPNPGALGPHITSTNSLHPQPQITIPSPPGVVLPYTQALIPAGVSLSRALPHSRPFQGSLHPWGFRYSTSLVPSWMNLRPPQHKSSA